MKRMLPFLIAVLLLVSCNRERVCNTPFGDVACSIDLSMPSYAPLNHVGGYVCLVGGHKGIFVVRTSYSEFLAYERACPNDHDVALVPDSEWDGAVLSCPECGSKFSVYTDGVALDGSATQCPLHQYFTSFNGQTLQIY